KMSVADIEKRIPEEIRKKYPDLATLMAGTESMTAEERDYWFQIMPIMTDDQVQKLRNILIHEKEQLAKLDTEYEAELAKLNDKHVLEWKEKEQREKREQIKQAESEEQAKEKANEEALLQQLESVDNPTPEPAVNKLAA
ncbi:MAG: hypothetical protein WCW30_02610, partial [Candidatus Gracilibacteria bacterium]